MADKEQDKEKAKEKEEKQKAREEKKKAKEEKQKAKDAKAKEKEAKAQEIKPDDKIAKCIKEHDNWGLLKPENRFDNSLFDAKNTFIYVAKVT